MPNEPGFLKPAAHQSTSKFYRNKLCRAPPLGEGLKTAFYLGSLSDPDAGPGLETTTFQENPQPERNHY